MKKLLFVENARLLAKKFDIIALIYGSLGLEYITGENLHADDIDILIPEKFLTQEWQAFKTYLEQEGYVLVDAREHTFQKNNVLYAYASVEEMETFAGIKISQMHCRVEDDVSFRVLSLAQYLKVYQASVQDGYRVNVRQKKDKEKIAFIENCLREKTEEEVCPCL